MYYAIPIIKKSNLIKLLAITTVVSGTMYASDQQPPLQEQDQVRKAIITVSTATQTTDDLYSKKVALQKTDSHTCSKKVTFVPMHPMPHAFGSNTQYRKPPVQNTRSFYSDLELFFRVLCSGPFGLYHGWRSIKKTPKCPPRWKPSKF